MATPAPTATYTYEEGVDGAAVASGANGVVAIAGTVTYSAAAKTHGTLGTQLSAASYALGYAAPASSFQASTYGAVTTLAGTANTTLYSVRNTSTQLGRVRLNSSGKFEIANGSNAAVATSTLTYTASTKYRLDVRSIYDGSGLTIALTARIYLGANLEGSVPDETITSTFAAASVPNRFYVGTGTSGWVQSHDTLRLYSDVSTWPDSYLTATTRMSTSQSTAWNVGAASVRVSTTQSTSWRVPGRISATGGTSWNVAPGPAVGSPPVAASTYTYEEGVDGAAVLSGSNGVVQIAGTVVYSAAAKFHGTMGVQLSAASAALGYASPASTFQASTYGAVTTIGTANTTLYSARATSSNLARVRLNSTGKFEIGDGANNVVATSTLTYTSSTKYRLDIRCVYNSTASTIALTSRIYLGANIEGSTPDETITATFTTASAPNRFYVGSGTNGWVQNHDSLRLYSDLSAWPDSFAFATSKVAKTQATAWKVGATSFRLSATQDTAWNVANTPNGPLLTTGFEGGAPSWMNPKTGYVINSDGYLGSSGALLTPDPSTSFATLTVNGNQLPSGMPWAGFKMRFKLKTLPGAAEQYMNLFEVGNTVPTAPKGQSTFYWKNRVLWTDFEVEDAVPLGLVADLEVWHTIECRVFFGSPTYTSVIRIDGGTPIVVTSPPNKNPASIGTTWIGYPTGVLDYTKVVDDVSLGAYPGDPGWFGDVSRISASASSSWAVRARTGPTPSTSWKTRSRISTTAGATWAIRNQLVKVGGGSAWAIRGLVTRTSGSAWSVAKRVRSVDVGVTWKARSRIATQVATQWAVAARTGASTHDTSWADRQATVRTVSTSWRTTGRPVLTSSTTWSARKRMVRTADVRWGYLARDLGITSSTAWDVRTRVESLAPTAWEVHLRVNLARRSNRWKVRARVVKKSPPQYWRIAPPRRSGSLVLLVDGVRKPAHASVVVGGVKKDVANMWVIKDGVKHRVV